MIFAVLVLVFGVVVVSVMHRAAMTRRTEFRARVRLVTLRQFLDAHGIVGDERQFRRFRQVVRARAGR